MKKLMFSVLGVFTLAIGETLYTDGTSDIETCVKPKVIASIDFPCIVREVYYSKEIQADVKPKAPKTVVFALKEGKDGALTAVCKDYSYTFVIKEGKDCDNHKVLIDKRLVQGKQLDITNFDKESLLNNARGLMKAMIKGEAVRGYEIKPFHAVSVINNDDYLKAHFSVVYDGSYLVGFVGKIKNYSRYIDKQVDASSIMQKGWVLLYIDGMEKGKVKLMPQEERSIFVVAIKSKAKIPYME